MTLPVAGKPLSLRQYGAHRRRLGLPGGDAAAVMRAIRAGRLSKSLVDVVVQGRACQQIADPLWADAEWAGRTDYSRAPDPVKLQAENYRADGRAADVVPPGDGSGEGDSLHAAGQRVKHWQAKQAELKFRTSARELVVAADIEKELAVLLGNVRTKVLGVASKYKARYMDTPTDRILALDQIIRDALLDVAAGNVSTDDDDAADDQPAALAM